MTASTVNCKPCVAVTQNEMNVSSDILELKHYPLIHFETLQFDETVLNRHYDWLLLTSKNAVDLFMPYMDRVSVDKIASIGRKTTSRLNRHGLTVDFESSSYTQEGIIEEFKGLQSDKILYPASKKARPKLYEYLTGQNCEVVKIPLYEPVDNHDSLTRLKYDMVDIDVITLSSPSGVSALMNQMEIDAVNDKTVMAIGEVTRNALQQYGVCAGVPEKETLEDMILRVEYNYTRC